VEKKEPEEKKVQIEIEKKKSNVKIINIPTVPANQSVKMDFLVVEEFSSYLYIYGSFGPDPGEERRSIAMATFSDYESYTKITNVVLWSPNLIICQIPSEGNGSKGKVIVRVDNDSAVRPLYEYNGVLNYVRPQGVQQRETKKERLRYYAPFHKGTGHFLKDYYLSVQRRSHHRRQKRRSHVRHLRERNRSAPLFKRSNCAG
jgi:hypothetical protein